MYNNLKIIFFSPVNWDLLQLYGYRKTAGAMFKQMCNQSQVDIIYYVQHEKRWGFSVKKKVIDANLTLIGLPIGFPFERFKSIRVINRYIQAALLKKSTKDTSANENLIYWFYDWFDIEIIDKMLPALTVMELTDSAEQFHAMNPRIISRLQSVKKKVASKVDVVFTVSPALTEEVPIGKCRVETMYNGIDSDFIQIAQKSHPEPEFYRNIQSFRILIVGTNWSLNYRLDHKLLKEVTQYLPNWNLIIIGCENILNKELNSLNKLDNVHLTGMKKQNDLIPYIQHAQICAVPYKQTHIPKRDPLKVYEYIACKKPVILTGDKVRPEFEPFVKRALDSDSFVKACLHFNRHNPFDNSKGFIEELYKMSWEKRFEKCMKIIFGLENMN